MGILKYACYVSLAIAGITACKPSIPKSQDTDIVNTPTVSTDDTTIHASTFPTKPVPGTIMTDEYLNMIGRYAYFWGWPLVNVLNRQKTFEQLPGPGLLGGILPVSPSNQLCMLTDYIKPEERAVACPNQDVIYGFGLTALEKDAVILQVPDFGDRFWVYQMVNQRTDAFAHLGKMYNSKPGAYLITGPDWKGTVPDGIAGVLKSNTNLNVILPRVFVKDDPADKASAQSLVNQICMYPLSEFTGKLKIVDWSKIRHYPNESKSETETKWVTPEKFFYALPEVLEVVPPQSGEEALYMQFRALLAASAKDSNIRNKLNKIAVQAEQELISPLFQFVNVGYPINYKWTTQRNGASFGVDYLTRTAVAKSNIFVNLPSETKYFYQDRDSSGTRLQGKSGYTVTFAKGGTPPVKGFWSLTLYNEHHFFMPNVINRYSLGTKNQQLKYNTDGSLTIYIQSASPGIDKESNWLPSPGNAAFSLYVRCYWPEDAAVNEAWTPPPVVRQ